MKQLRQWLYIIPVFLFISAFQNCSVYKTSGRKFVEDGSAKRAYDIQQGQSASTSATGQTSKANSSCEPYVTNAAASAAMGVASSTRLVLNESNDSVSCVVSTDSPSQEPALDVVACSISGENLELLQNAPDESMVLDPYGPLSRGSFGFSRVLANGSTQFVFVGSSDSALEAIACQFTFESQAEYLALRDHAIEKSAMLVHKIHENMR